MSLRGFKNLLIGLLVFWFYCQSSFAITAGQLQLLNGLSPEDRAKAIAMVSGGQTQSQKSVRTDFNAIPEVKNLSDQSDIEAEPQFSMRQEPLLGIGSSMIVYFDERVQKKQTFSSRNKPFLYTPDQPQLLFKLDKQGEINISGIGRIPLSGLTEEEAAARINLEPLLADYVIRVKILPLDELGVSGLKAFGYDLFQQSPEMLSPDMAMPVPESYIVGPGDQVHIQLLGKENQEYTLEVSRDSTLSLPGVGVFSVSGLQFEDLKKDIKKRIKRRFIGVDSFITLGALRSIRVFVLGEVNKPGVYSVSALSTITGALAYSQGITNIGSLRNVELKRDGKLVSRLDLYDLLVQGNTKNDVRIRAGDVIHVPPINKSISILGEIRRPGIYELKDEKSIADVITLAGGLLPTAMKNKIKIERVLKNNNSLLELDLTKPSWNQTHLLGGDVITISSILERQDNVVLLKGDVLRQGQFQWKPGLRLTDVIPNIRVLKETADSEYVLIKQYQDPNLELVVKSANLREALANPAGNSNIRLQPRDEIVVFSLNEKRTLQIQHIIDQLAAQSNASEPTQIVRVLGQVRGPGSYPLEKGMRISDLIIAGGRLSESAYTLDAELTRFIAEPGKPRAIEHLDVNLEGLLAGNESDDFQLQPFDLLNIKEIPLWKEEDQVELVGEVRFPGKYAIQRGETLFQLLERAGGLTQFAYPEGAVFIREDLRKREQERLDAMASNLEAELASISLERSGDPTQVQSVGTAKQLLSKLRSTDAAGRLVIDLKTISQGESDEDGESQSIFLRGGDKLFVPSQMQEVSVIGQVFHPTSHLFQDSLNVEDYVNLSGGMTKKADDDSVYVIRANGAVELADNSWLDTSPDMYPGDTVVVPLDAERMSSLKLWGSISQIVYQLGLSAAAWNTVGLFE